MDNSVNNPPTIGIVVPCYNEQEVFGHTLEQLIALLQGFKERHIVNQNSFIAFVDDGSKDKTWELIENACSKYPEVKGLKLATNAGHQKALLSGLLTFKDRADCLISIDADLQDDIRVIEEMVLSYSGGNQIVYGVRKDRTTDTFFKRQSAHGFYRIMRSMNVKVLYNHADFRLASRQVLNELEKFGEVNLFLRGIFPLLGFNHSVVYYDRLERMAGESKYPLRKMLSFAWDGITSFSIKPLRFVTTLGFLVFFGSLIMSLYAVFSYLEHRALQGWVSTVLPLYFLGGIQLLCVGIIGEYIGKIFLEVKGRPRYIIEKIIE